MLTGQFTMRIHTTSKRSKHMPQDTILFVPYFSYSFRTESTMTNNLQWLKKASCNAILMECALYRSDWGKNNCRFVALLLDRKWNMFHFWNKMNYVKLNAYIILRNQIYNDAKQQTVFRFSITTKINVLLPFSTEDTKLQTYTLFQCERGQITSVRIALQTICSYSSNMATKYSLSI